MYSWDQYKEAVQDYARLRPRVLVTTVVPTVSSPLLALPANTTALLAVAYGVEMTPLEFVDATVQGWAFFGGALYLTPAPIATTPVRMVYAAGYVPDEGTETVPTLPAVDLPLVADLATALALDAEADNIANGPVVYSIGQTEVDRSKALIDLRARATALRQRVHQRLDEPVAAWR